MEFSPARSLALVRRRWRIFVSAACGLVVGLAASRLGAQPGAAALFGWDSASALYLTLTAGMLFGGDEATLRANAKREDENRAVIMSIILACAAFSFGAIVVAQRESHGHHGLSQPVLIALSLATIALSWCMVQATFTLHYAHHYFGDRDDNGRIDGGVRFTGDPPSTYRDFIYMAVCIGCCFQVSDFSLTDTSFRNLVTVHAVLSFAFNTVVLALGINMVASLVGG